jgi:hypothetical protein
MNYNVKWDVIGFLIVVAGTLLSFVGCDPVEMKRNEITSSAQKLSKELHYYKDSNTHLCFAAYHVGLQSTSITNVPCTPEVEKMVDMFSTVK